MYDPMICSEAVRILSQRRQRATLQAEENRAELLTNMPELARIEAALAQTGAKLARMALSGQLDAAALDELRQMNAQALTRRKALLEHVGLEENFLEPAWACPNCQDTGFLNGKRCTCHTRLLNQLAKKQIPVLAGADNYTFENFSLDYYTDDDTPQGDTSGTQRQHMRQVLDKCKTFANAFGGDSKCENLILLGRTGLGKTHLSLAVAAQVLQRGYHVIYVSAQELIDSAERQKFGRAPIETAPLSRRALGCELLVLDDLGSEFSTPFAISTLFHLINTRLIEGRATIISTNLSPSEMDAKYGERIVSRLLCSYTLLPVVGSDIRLAKKGQALPK